MAPVILILVDVFTPVFNVLAPMATVLDKASAPPSLLILALFANVIGPANVLVPLKFLITPSAFNPVPDILIGSAANVTPPSTCNALPVLIVVLPEVAPKALPLVFIFKIPAAVVVAVPIDILPVYPVLFPLKVK